MALHEGDILFNTPLMSITLDEESISVVSNDKINIETTTDINIGKSVFQTKDGEVTEETKNIKMETEDLTTFCVENGNNAIELDTDSAIYVLTTSKMEGSVKANLPNITSEGQQEKEAVQKAQAEAERKAREEAERHVEEAKRQAEEDKGIQWGRIGAGLLKVAAGIAIAGIAVAATVATGGLALAAVGAASGAIAGVAAGGSVIVAGAAVVGAGAAVVGGAVTTYAAANALQYAGATTFEGVQDVVYGSQGKTEDEQHSVNKIKDEGFRGDSEAYTTAILDNFVLMGMGYMMAAGGCQLAVAMATQQDRLVAMTKSVENKPLQNHHYLTNKSKTYTKQFENITKKYNLDLDDTWNKDLMPHQGRHPNAYHDYVLDQVKQFDEIAQGDKDLFLELMEGLKNGIKSNPDMLYKNYWLNQ